MSNVNKKYTLSDTVVILDKSDSPRMASLTYPVIDNPLDFLRFGNLALCVVHFEGLTNGDLVSLKEIYLQLAESGIEFIGVEDSNQRVNNKLIKSKLNQYFPLRYVLPKQHTISQLTFFISFHKKKLDLRFQMRDAQPQTAENTPITPANDHQPSSPTKGRKKPWRDFDMMPLIASCFAVVGLSFLLYFFYALNASKGGVSSSHPLATLPTTDLPTTDNVVQYAQQQPFSDNKAVPIQQSSVSEAVDTSVKTEPLQAAGVPDRAEPADVAAQTRGNGDSEQSFQAQPSVSSINHSKVDSNNNAISTQSRKAQSGKAQSGKALSSAETKTREADSSLEVVKEQGHTEKRVRAADRQKIGIIVEAGEKVNSEQAVVALKEVISGESQSSSTTVTREPLSSSPEPKTIRRLVGESSATSGSQTDVRSQTDSGRVVLIKNFSNRLESLGFVKQEVMGTQLNAKTVGAIGLSAPTSKRSTQAMVESLKMQALTRIHQREYISVSDVSALYYIDKINRLSGADDTFEDVMKSMMVNLMSDYMQGLVNGNMNQLDSTQKSLIAWHRYVESAGTSMQTKRAYKNIIKRFFFKIEDFESKRRREGFNGINTDPILTSMAEVKTILLSMCDQCFSHQATNLVTVSSPG